MQKSKLGLDHPVDMVYHVQPWMIVSILPFAIGFEGKMTFVSFEKSTYSFFKMNISGC